MGATTMATARIALAQIRMDNHFDSSNIVLANESELVVVSSLPDGTLVIHEFCRTLGGTALGNNIRKKLLEEGFTIRK